VANGEAPGPGAPRARVGLSGPSGLRATDDPRAADGPKAQPPSFLVDEGLRFLMFGGKGGVGKTTVAAATALHWAQQRPGTVLVISTDPAHSLSDAFEQPIGDQITPVNGEPQLFAWEVDAGKRLQTFKERYGDAIETIMDRGTYFDHDDIRQFLDLSLPGLDELMAVIEIAELVREGRYGLVILDTAPTGHTLRLLALPELMAQWLHVLDLMLEKHRYMQSVFGRRRRDETDAFMEGMTADMELLRALLRTPLTTEFVPVTIPEAMSVTETGRLVDTLEAMGVPVRTVVVNRVARRVEETGCPFCARRRREQQPSLREIAARFGAAVPGAASPAAFAASSAAVSGTAAVSVPLLPHQVHGQAGLRRFAGLLYGAGPLEIDAAPGAPAAPAAPAEPARSVASAGIAGTARITLEQTFVLVGGKGGVGKTTIAAATALHLARKHEGRRVLLFSVDPAHSLSDCLGQDLGHQIVAVDGVAGLDALEMEATSVLAEVSGLYAGEMREAFAAFGAGGDLQIAFDRRVMEELISLAPPGLDELMALMRLMDLVQEGRYAAYVLDLAPTGHALRLLETPALVRQWFMVLFRLLLKYQNVFSLARAGELVRQKSKQLRQVEQLLTDAERCQLLAVTIPEDLAVQETRRLLEGLARIPTRCSWVVANMVSAPGSCAFCAAVHEEQIPCLRELETLGPSCIRVPALSFEPRGVDALERVARLIY
jgi:arsenite-transporting ATPase